MSLSRIEVPVGSLPGRAQKPTSMTGQWEASVPVRGLVTGEAGIWECNEGRFTSDRTTFAEVCFILSGRADIVSDANAETQTVGPGDLFVLPRGWTGTWEIHEAIRKIYVTLPDRSEELPR